MYIIRINTYNEFVTFLYKWIQFFRTITLFIDNNEGKKNDWRIDMTFLEMDSNTCYDQSDVFYLGTFIIDNVK